MDNDNTEIAHVLDKAAAHIEKVGWLQGDLYDDYTDRNTPLEQCPVCAMGALNMALHGTPRFPLTVLPGELMAHDVADYVERSLNGVELADWNDAEGRTQADVTGLLRKTATELRAA